MKTSVKWLSQYVPLPDAVSELTDALTLAGLEVEGVNPANRAPAQVVVGKITSRDQHPNADRLSVCTVDAGEERERTIVCGADNCDAGKYIPVALPGACLAGDVEVRETKLRGESSEGMLCSERELGIGDEYSGLMELSSEWKPGTPFQEVLGEPDTVVDWEITPNRPDWLSHIGIARETAAVFDCCNRLELPAVPEATLASDHAGNITDVAIEDAELCPRYVARVIRNVTIAPSPQWLQKRLRAVGLRPINNVVDVTNFVLLECGQPLHAFDYDKLNGGRIVVRPAEDKEKIQTIDEQEHELSPDHLVIADAKRPVALAGVMGGADSGIEKDTTTVLLESAAFDPSNIRATAKTFGMQTASSYRFERGISLSMVAYASQRAAELICRLGGGEQLQGAVDVYPNPPQKKTVSCRYDRANKLLGVDISPDNIQAYLQRLGFDFVQHDESKITVVVPDFRHDIEREVDLIEEIARMHSLEAIPAQPATAPVGGSFEEDAYHVTQQAREEFLAVGLDEGFNYTLLSEGEATYGTGFGEHELIRLQNPISSESACLRPSLIPGLLRTLDYNIAHGNQDLSMFEIGRVMANASRFPEERMQTGILLSGRRHPERFGEEREQVHDFFDLKGIIESWFRMRKISDYTCQATQHPAFKDTACAEVYIGDRPVGVFGEIAEKLTKDIRLRYAAYMAVIELTEVMSLPGTITTYTSLPQFPATVRDVSVLVPRDIQHKQILETLHEGAPAYLEDITLVDVYQNEQLKQAKQWSMTYSLTYRAPDRTLTDDEVNTMQEQTRQHLQEKLSIELR